MHVSWEGPGPDTTPPPAAGGRWERVAPGVLRRRLPRWDATVGAVLGVDGVLLVDAGAELREGEEIRREVRAAGGREVRWIALTHQHFDHVLGAGAFPGARTYAAAPAAAPGATADPHLGPPPGYPLPSLVEDAVAHGLDRSAATASAEALTHPFRPLTAPLRLELGAGRQAWLVPVGPGHTGGDLAVWVPGGADGRDVVFCGDLVEQSGEPQAGPDAWPDRWPAALDRLLDLGGEHARYVPGHGAVVDAEFVRAQREALVRRFGGPR